MADIVRQITGKAKRRAIVVTGGLLMLSAVLLSAHLITAPPHKNATRETDTAEIKIDSADVAPHLKDGDVICRMGDRIWSTLIGNVSQGKRRFSHLGIVRIRDSTITVINAECLTPGRNESVNETALADFLILAKTVGVYRANFIDGAALAQKATEYLGRPFDWDFDLDDESKIYCTELLYAVIKHTAPKHTPKPIRIRWHSKPIIPPEVAADSPDFDEILYIDPRQVHLPPISTNIVPHDGRFLLFTFSFLPLLIMFLHYNLSNHY